MVNMPKGQHFVPEVILKRFVDDDGWMHVARKDDAANIRPTRVGKAFKQSHLYSQISDDGSKNPEIETELARLEGHVSPILDLLVAGARSDVLPDLTPSQFDLWYRFFIVQWKRVPDLHAAVGSQKAAEAMLSQVHADLRKKHPSRISEIDALAKPEVAARTVRNTRARAVLNVSPRIMELFRSRGIRLIRTKPKKSFVIGSRPVVQMGFETGLTLYDLATEMWLPIAHDVIAGVGGGAPMEIRKFDDQVPIRKFNAAVLKQSSAFGCRSPELAASLASDVWAG